MTIKVYGVPLSSSTSRVLATLREKDVSDYELVKTDWMNEAQIKGPEYLALQPFGKIPVMVDGPLTLFESRAIARVIAHKFEGQGTPLCGSTPNEKALVEQWLEVESQNFNPVVIGILQEKFSKPLIGEQPDEAVVQANVEKLDKVLDVYDAQLSKSKYLAGDCFSLADLSHLPYMNFLIRFCKLGNVIFEARPHVKAWWEDISSRPAWTHVAAMANEEMKSFEPK